MKVNESPDPMKVGLLRAQAVVLSADRISHRIEQARGCCSNRATFHMAESIEKLDKKA